MDKLKYTEKILDLDDPLIAEILEQAIKLQNLCLDADMPQDIVIHGVAPFGGVVVEKAYIAGKEYEKDRIATLLGVNTNDRE